MIGEGGRGSTYIHSQDILRRICLPLQVPLEINHDARTAGLAEAVGLGFGVEGVGAEIVIPCVKKGISNALSRNLHFLLSRSFHLA